MLIRNVTIGTGPDRRRGDVRLDGDRIAAIGTDLRGEELLDVDGARVLPGLVDHHLHLHAMAAADASVNLGGLDLGQAADALAAAEPDEHGWVRAVGLGRDLDGAALDALHPHRPVRAQHQSGAQWTINTVGIRLLGLDTADHGGIERTPTDSPTGRIRRADQWLRERLPARALPDLGAVGQRLARYGITAVTDATPDVTTFDVSALPQRVTLLGVGLECAPPPGAMVGPFKIVLADPDLPDLDDLCARIRAAHGSGRSVAVHCVTREALALLLAALAVTGTQPGDRIEHAALVPAEVIPVLAAAGLRVVTQPGFLAARGDEYRRTVPVDDHPDLYRCASLLAAGIPLALSSDAPYGPLDPRIILEAAITRITPDGAPLGLQERLRPEVALSCYLAASDEPGGPPRQIEPGAVADLVLRNVDDEVVATVIAGRRVI